MYAAPPANFNRVRRVVFMSKLLPTMGVFGNSLIQVHGAPSIGLMQVAIIFGKRETFANVPSRRHSGQKTSRTDRHVEPGDGRLQNAGAGLAGRCVKA